MKLKVYLKDEDGNGVEGEMVSLSIPVIDLIDSGAKTGNKGVIVFDLPETIDESLYIFLYVNGVKKWAGYISNKDDTLYLSWP